MLQGLFVKVKEQADQAASSSDALHSFIEGCLASVTDISSSAGRVSAESERQSGAVGSATNAIGEILTSIGEVKESVATQASFIEETSSASTR